METTELLCTDSNKDRVIHHNYIVVNIDGYDILLYWLIIIMHALISAVVGFLIKARICCH